MKGTTLRADVVRAVADASELLYKIEKRLLERFPRDRRYVSTFFPDGRRKPKTEPPE